MFARRPTSSPTLAHEVGGLPRGTEPEDLSKLIGRVLPDGAGQVDVEIMRDQQTGLERGFGYVTMPSGAVGKEGAERAISTYNGTRCVF